ncbi:hypothetical protein [Photobacterium sp. 1_MG-2023]|uniref:AbiTii domain-containing protein n=1 Tax=Photobacterium sp. 1_MG-2023 TaxID=3062646 RepID=UPI0026E3334C|nr:hypothetical protein [Photobacterium sp. 1_MG-2023]MDO6705300.1 hypothetical protein [Photobacterium sp. 1_MG-2023]
MSIIQEIQEDALNSECSLSLLLMKAFDLAQKLALTDFSRWLQNEIEGYACSESELPEYRKLRGQLSAFDGRRWVPVQREGSNSGTAYLYDSIAEIESALNRMGHEIYHPCYGEQSRWFSKSSQNQPQDAIVISRSLFIRVLNKVRTYLFNWAIELEMNGVQEEDIFSLPATEK